MKLFKVKAEFMVVAESEEDIDYFEIDEGWCDKEIIEVKNKSDVLTGWLGTNPFGEVAVDETCRRVLEAAE